MRGTAGIGVKMGTPGIRPEPAALRAAPETQERPLYFHFQCSVPSGAHQRLVPHRVFSCLSPFSASALGSVPLSVALGISN